MSGGSGARLRVDLGRIRANVDALRARIGDAEVMLVVKNDAYGHGVERVVADAAAHGVARFGSFDVPTGVRARAAAGPDARVFAWVTVGRKEVAAAIDARLELGVGDRDYLEDVAAVSRGRGVPVHLKIDTGLHRNGVRPEDWAGFVGRAAALEASGDIRVVGLWSHIAETSEAADDAARAEFLAGVDAARAAGLSPRTLHLAASAAGYARPEFRFDMVRFGAFCYGVRSTDGPELPGIAPAATLLAPVVAVDADTVEIGVGALDGVPSTLAQRFAVGTVAGARRVRAVGDVSLTVEAWPGATPGQDVAVFGPGALGESSATTLAEAIGTVGEEILVRVSPLVPRDYVG
ncbi:alanine racemase [Microbacterium sp. SORGH_AS_0888]|uniref:alanine racemase n=1 Tax=Microbacterium sp. SORGH_AS_0888 TaxID=3041791 RepID=UPI0027833747|nr:alanine racemase [Microbacterium sp. SORGH_AS_0888]MDQ1129415.1 alanine racemase [Microbacterium sp. SORGH_AS_0888]